MLPLSVDHAGYFSPYRMRVLPKFEPQKVRISGDGVQPLGEVPSSIPVTFTVDTRDAGYADLEVLVLVSLVLTDFCTCNEISTVLFRIHLSSHVL